MPTFRDANITLTDSHAILIYLIEKYGEPGNNLWPSDPIDRINVLNKLFYSGTLLFRRDSDAIVSCFFNLFNEKIVIDLIKLQINTFKNQKGQIIVHKLRKEQLESDHIPKIREQYGILEQFLSSHEFMASNQVWKMKTNLMFIVKMFCFFFDSDDNCRSINCYNRQYC